MTSTDLMNNKGIAWLLEEESPGVRYLALRDLLDLPHYDEELKTACKNAHEQGPISKVLEHMDENGFWMKSSAPFFMDSTAMGTSP